MEVETFSPNLNPNLNLQSKYLCMCFQVTMTGDLCTHLVLGSIEATALIEERKQPDFEIKSARSVEEMNLVEEKKQPEMKKIFQISSDKFPIDIYNQAVMSGSKIYFMGGSIETPLFERRKSVYSPPIKPNKGVITIDISGSDIRLDSKQIPPMEFGKIDPLLMKMNSGKIYAIEGNFIGIRSELQFEVYDPLGNKWLKDVSQPSVIDHTSAVTLDGRLHVSNRYDSFYFDEDENKWEISSLFDDFPFDDRLFELEYHVLEEDLETSKSGGGMPFPFTGLGIVLQLPKGGQVLICYSEIGGHTAFLLENGKVIDRQYIKGLRRCLYTTPRYVDLGGGGYFSAVSCYTSVDFGTIISVNTYRIQLVNAKKRSRSSLEDDVQHRRDDDRDSRYQFRFLDVCMVNEFFYPFPPPTVDRQLVWETIGCFLVNKDECSSANKSGLSK